MSSNLTDIPVAIVGLTAQEVAVRLDEFGPKDDAIGTYGRAAT